MLDHGAENLSGFSLILNVINTEIAISFFNNFLILHLSWQVAVELSTFVDHFDGIYLDLNSIITNVDFKIFPSHQFSV